MDHDLAARIRRKMRGETTSKSGVTCVTGVAPCSHYVSNPLKLRQLRQLRLKNNDLGKGVISGVTEGVIGPPEPDEAKLEERKALAMGSVPELYLDGWARLQCQQPANVTEACWRQAIDDAGRLLDQWGSLAVEFGWTAGDLFDVPRGGKPGGLVWCIEGCRVNHLGDETAVMNDYRAFDRTTGRVV